MCCVCACVYVCMAYYVLTSNDASQCVRKRERNEREREREKERL